MIRTKYRTVGVTPTIDTDAYADGDVIGGLLTFDFQLVSGGIINQVLVVDDDDEGAALKLYLFDGTPSTIADDAAFAPTLADLQKLCGLVEISSYETINSNSFARVTDINDAFEGRRLFGYLVANGSTPTYTAATDLSIYITVAGD